MLESRVVSIPIDRPLAEAYDFMSEPRNVAAWATVPVVSFRHVRDLEYAVDLPEGPAVMRFTPRNDYGVLDCSVTPVGSAVTRYVPARVFANGAGCELQLVMLRQQEMSAEAFASEQEWITADLLVLKSLLELSR